jgi:hypothetical protein
MINMHCCGVSYNLFKRILDLAECSGTSLLPKRLRQLGMTFREKRVYGSPLILMERKTGNDEYYNYSVVM